MDITKEINQEESWIYKDVKDEMKEMRNSKDVKDEMREMRNSP